MDNDEIIRVLNHLIGTPYVPQVRDYIREFTGRAHVHGPHDMIDIGFDSHRITVQTDIADRLISGFSFG